MLFANGGGLRPPRFERHAFPMVKIRSSTWMQYGKAGRIILFAKGRIAAPPQPHCSFAVTHVYGGKDHFIAMFAVREGEG